MASTATIDLGRVSQSLGLPTARVQTVVELLDGGNTVPFITRYRKDQTGGLDEEQIRQIQSRVVKLRLLAERKQTILRSIDSQGKLTPELAETIGNANSTRQLEDLYLPFKPKKQTLATVARGRGLEPLAQEILAAAPACADLDARARDFVNPDRQVTTAADALLGAGHILAETFSERADLRGKLRAILERTGRLVTTAGETETKAARQEPPAPAASDPAAPPASGAVGGGSGDLAVAAATVAVAAPPAATRAARKKKKKKDEANHKAFRDYFNYTEALAKVPPHRVLAINRGERARSLRVRVETDLEAMQQAVDELLVPAGQPHADFLRGCGRDALVRLVLPSLEREVRRELTERAELHAVQVFARNLRNLLLQPPIRDRRVLAIDPGFKSGCKLAALDEFGKMLDQGVAHLVGNPERRSQAGQLVATMVRQHQLSVVAIGNGTGCRETEQWISELIAGELADAGVSYTIVNEAGASVYSTSRLAREEFPEYDATLRGAISIGRRLQDPLSELVKIEAANIGVGMYQHDVKAKHLRDSLDAVVASCVNFVGVDLNSASPALLRYVSGLNQLTAQRLFDYRTAHGPFKSRDELKSIQGFGEATFVQAAGFLKIVGGSNPLDATWIHPESYHAARQVLSTLSAAPEDLSNKESLAALAQRVAQVHTEQLAVQLQVGTLTLADIVSQLVRPGRDPRESLPKPIFKKGILKLDDLTAGMELAGTVLNVVDFGAFIDIGLKDSGLVHISQLANKYVQDPHEVVSVGDIVHVWVLEVDKERRRVSLTMIKPGTPRRAGEARQASPRGDQQRTAGGAARQRRGAKPVTAQAPAAKKPAFKAAPARPRPKPKPVVPLTKDMKEGKAPLRTFGDLKQFWTLKQQETAGEEEPTGS